MFSKAIAIFNLVLGLILIGFTVYFILCSFVLYVDAATWRHFMWGVGVLIELFAGIVYIYTGIKELIKHRGDK